MDNSAQAAMIKLAVEMKSWKSVELKTRHELTRYAEVPGLTGDFFNLHEQHYVETKGGERFMETVRRSATAPARRDAGYCDGETCSQIVFCGIDLKKQIEFRITRSFLGEGEKGSTTKPLSLIFLHVGKTPIYEALSEARGLGSGRVIGRDVNLFLFPRLRWAMTDLHLVYSLDRGTSSPLKVEAYKSLEARELGQPIWIWTAQKLEVVAGHPIVTESEWSTFTAGKESPRSSPELVRKNKEVVESVEFDKEYPHEFFRASPQKEALVIDSIKGKMTPPPRTLPLPSDGTPGQVVRAEPYSNWTSFYSLTSVGIGVLLCLSALVVWVRNKRK